jgi:hypothetical protein
MRSYLGQPWRHNIQHNGIHHKADQPNNKKRNTLQNDQQRYTNCCLCRKSLFDIMLSLC